MAVIAATCSAVTSVLMLSASRQSPQPASTNSRAVWSLRCGRSSARGLKVAVQGEEPPLSAAARTGASMVLAAGSSWGHTTHTPSTRAFRDSVNVLVLAHGDRTWLRLEEHRGIPPRCRAPAGSRRCGAALQNRPPRPRRGGSSAASPPFARCCWPCATQLKSPSRTGRDRRRNDDRTPPAPQCSVRSGP